MRAGLRSAGPGLARSRSLLCLLVIGCASELAEEVATPMGGAGQEVVASRDEAGGVGNAREEVLGAFLSAYWRVPVPAQGAAPEGFSAAERSLHPRECGACHPEQHRQWQGSLHAGAYSPGLAGQLVEGRLSEAARLRSCQSCHAPLAEQQPERESGEAEPAYDAALRGQGIVCASCHVRAHRHFGPPRRPGLPPLAEALPHGGFEARTEFEESRFCAECHQFFDDEGVAGKPVQNTWAEWRASPAAAAGRSCQSCHMPDRAHTWRGIHDPEMVRAGVDVEWVSIDLAADPLRAALVLSNRDVGHAFPTYVTPRVFLEIWQVGAAGRELDGTHSRVTIGREIDFGAWQERFDTRVLPGESMRLDYEQARHPLARGIVGRVRIDPAYHYRSVFASLLESLESKEALDLMAEALERADAAPYVLTEIRRDLPDRRAGAGR